MESVPERHESTMESVPEHHESTMESVPEHHNQLWKYQFSMRLS